MLTSLIVPRSRPLRAHVTLNKGFISNDSSSQWSRHRIQTRAFRFGLWSSLLDSASHYELRRRCRNLKQDYANAINKKLSWLDSSPPEEPNLFGKRTVTKYRSRRVYLNEPDSQKPETYHSLFATYSFDPEPRQPKIKRSYGNKYRNGWYPSSRSCIRPQGENEKKPENPDSNGSKGTLKWPPTIEIENSAKKQDYVIDIITNRKVPKGALDGPVVEMKSPLRGVFSGKLDSKSSASSNLEREESAVEDFSSIKDGEWAADISPPLSNVLGYGKRSGTTSSQYNNSTSRKEEYTLNHLPPEDPVEDHGGLDNCQKAIPDEHAEKPEEHDISHKSTHMGQPTSEMNRLQNELKKYGPYMYNQELPQRVTPDEPNASDLESYRSRVDEIPEISTKQPSQYDDLHKYEPTTFDKIKDEDHSPKKYGDLEKYRSFGHQDSFITRPLERDAVAESLKEYDGKEQYDETAYHNDDSKCGTDPSTKLPRMTLSNGYLSKEPVSVQEGHGTANSSDPTAPTRQELQRRMNELNENHNTMDRVVQFNLRKTLRNLKHVQTPKSSEPLSGNTSQESTEESVKAQDAVQRGSVAMGKHEDVSRVPSSQEGQKSDENTERKASSPQTSGDAQDSRRIEPAWDRMTSARKNDHLSRAYDEDLYSKEPQGLETSFYEECGGRHTMPIYTRTYSSEPGQVAARSKSAENEERDGSAESSFDTYYHRDPEVDGIPNFESAGHSRDNRGTTRSDETTTYKILVCDPDTLSIKVAEITSTALDQEKSLSPAEVIPQLSHPTRFFPYFSSLEAEGFEIVKGGPDVLIFRQIRPGKATGQGGATVNPIDMMGRPAAVPNAAAFVSPTGFVNYDVPQVDAHHTEPPFRSNIYVHREEPVFSGQHPSAKIKKPRFKWTRRVFIGGASVAGMGYAAGVVNEYFTTGGSDGKGPTGFSPK